MHRAFLWAIVALLTVAVTGTAQETYFGKNKVRYKGFDWGYIQTRHFDIHFYEDAYETARFAANSLEAAYDEVSEELNYYIQKRIPVFIYNSHNDFQQTNILSSLIGEGTGGFTEAFKNRVVIPFNGSYEDFRHVLHHELTHAVTFDMLYGGSIGNMLSRRRLFSMPLWLAEGYAEYSSRHGWDYFTDMWVRDATINGYLYPFEYLTGYNAYREGQAIIKYIADTYGQDKVGQLFKNGRIHISMDVTVEKTLGVKSDELFEDFSREMKRRYWPEIARRSEIEEVATKLTDARKDGSYMNEKPIFNPEGDKLAMYTDRSDYTEIVLISADDGRVLRRVVKSQRSGDLESLHSFVSGASFSPDGRKLVFVAKANGKETLVVYDIVDVRETFRRSFDYYNMLSPEWSPDGEKIAFSALEGNKRDLFVYHLATDSVVKITNDRYDDTDPSWYPDSKRLIFTTDRPHPQNKLVSVGDHPYLVTLEAYRPGDFDYGQYNLFEVAIEGGHVTPVELGPGRNRRPTVSPDGTKIAFISNRNGIDNAYVAYVDSSNQYAVTDILTGVDWLSWSPDGKSLALQAFNKGLYDVFILKELKPAGNNGVLTLTDWAREQYNHGLEAASADSTIPSETGEAPDSEGGGILAAVEEEAPDPGDDIDESKPADDAGDDSVNEAPLDLTEPDVSLSAAVPDDTNLEPVAEDDSAAEADSAATDSTAGDDEAADTDDEEEVIDSTGIYDDEFVFVGEEPRREFGEFFEDVPHDSLMRRDHSPRQEPESFDSIPTPEAGGEYEVHEYRVKFTPDYVGGGFAYDTFYGLRGQTVFMFSDYLSNHTIVIATDLVNTLDQSYINAYYFNSTHRTSFGVGLFHSKNFYIDTYNYLFSDRFYGFSGLAFRPFSTFSRMEFVASQVFIDREYLDRPYDTRENRSSAVTTGTLSYVTDNIIWGLTGPINGRRAKMSLTGGVNLFDASDIDFYALELDYRRYWHLSDAYSFAFRVAGAASGGRTPKRYFMGGTTNYIGNVTIDAEVYDVENLYFNDVVTPLRSLDYYGISGTRYGLINMEFRYPMIDYFVMRFPLQLVLSRVGGAIFIDMGAAWDGNDFRGGTTQGGRSRLQDIKTGFGLGMRANLGFVLLRYDVAWGTDFYKVSDRSSHYFSIGADF